MTTNELISEQIAAAIKADRHRRRSNLQGGGAVIAAAGVVCFLAGGALALLGAPLLMIGLTILLSGLLA